jgi:pectate lyase
VVGAEECEPASRRGELANDSLDIVKVLLRTSLLLLVFVGRCCAQTPAFPGAQGGGAGATGGRGGRVIEVTNLQDSGDGSLRACLEAKGPRTCVFRVGGVIHVGVGMRVYNDNLTIAGQTAPGGGITLDGSHSSKQAVLFLSASNIIVRFITIRIGNGPGHSPGPSTGAVAFEVANALSHDIIFDHVSASWWDNKGLLYLSNFNGPNMKITAQWSMFYEPHAGHPVGPSISSNPDPGKGFGNLETDLDYHHNFFANTGHRIPQLWNKSTRWVNNIVYNWDFYASELLGQVDVDFIGNKYKAGPLNHGAQRHEIEVSPKGAAENLGDPTLYLVGNIGPNLSDPAGDQWSMAAEVAGENGKEIGPIPGVSRRATPLQTERFPIVADPATELDARLLPTVGNSMRLDCMGNWVARRDPVDARVIAEYQSGTRGEFYTKEDAEHRIPQIDAGTPCQDSDHDGIPDAWEIAHGLNPKNPNDAKKLNPDGYTNLEHYLNGSTAQAQAAGIAAMPPIIESSVQAAQPRLAEQVKDQSVRLLYRLESLARRVPSYIYGVLTFMFLLFLYLVGRLFGQRRTSSSKVAATQTGMRSRSQVLR